jgi:branched-chain amino acid transport system substrate-binding protein
MTFERMAMRRWLLAAMMAVALMPAGPSRAQEKTIKIGILSDMSGIYADFSGTGAVVAAELAIEDYTATNRSVKVELLRADHQNKADIAATTARRWFDVEGVNAIAELVHSASALAVAEIARNSDRVVLISGSSSSDITGKSCSPNTVHWTYDSWSQSAALAGSVVKGGGDTWFLLVSDSAAGAALERDVGAAVQRQGGRIVGAVRVPLNASDMASFLQQAVASKAKVIAFALGGGDFSNALKQAQEFGVTETGQQIVAPVLFETDVRGLSLATAQKLRASTSFYWDLNDGTRSFAERFAKRHRGAMPTMVQAGVYASVLHYLKAAEQGDFSSGRQVVARMKAMPTDDPLFGRGSIRIDGRKIQPMYLFEVKKPSESKGPWDLLHILETIPADRSIRPLAEGGCSLTSN